MTDEIAMNPGYFAIRSLRKTLSVLAMNGAPVAVPLWRARPAWLPQQEWAARMEALGLMPSNTGAHLVVSAWANKWITTSFQAAALT